MMKPFRVGDYIVSKDGEGTVHTIGLVYTVLNTVDNKQVVIPNGTLSNSPLTNVTAMDKRRVDIKIGIGYSSDLKRAKEILEQIYVNHPSILKEESMWTSWEPVLSRSAAAAGLPRRTIGQRDGI